MGLIKGIVKGASLAVASAVCPPAAGVLLLGNLTYKVGKAISDDNNDLGGPHALDSF